MTDREKNSATVSAFWDAVARRDIDAYLSLFTEGAVAHDPVNKPALATPEARRAHMQGIFDMLPTLLATVDFSTHCGDRTATKWTVTGKTAEGQSVTLEGVDIIHHAADGRIAEMWGYFDN